MLTILANISIKRTLYSVANDRLTCKVSKSNGLNPFDYSFYTTVNLFLKYAKK